MADDQTNPAWVPQADGTYLPSQELVERIRANPQEFPDAAKDFAIMSGKSEEEVQEILDNRLRSGSPDRVPWALRPDMQLSVIEGLGKAAGWAVENVGEGLLGIEGADDLADTIRETTDLNPAFETEEGVGEKVGEFVGQVGPAVAAGIATGGAGLAGFLTGAAVGGGVSTATFDPRDQTLVAVIEDTGLELGPLGDALRITDEDSDAAAMGKQFLAGAVVELAAAGAFKVLGKVGSLISRGNPDEAEAALREAEEAGEIALPKTPSAVEDVVEAEASAAARAPEEVAPEPAPTPREAEAGKVPTEVTDQVLRAEARSDIQQVIDEGVAGQQLPKLPVTEGALKTFEDDVMRFVDRFDARTGETTNLTRLSASARTEMTKHAREVYTAIRGGDLDRVAQLAREGVRLQGELDEVTKNAASVYQTSIVNSALRRTSDLSGELVAAIRKDPSLKTREAIRSIAHRSLVQSGELWDIYRNLGSKSSYEFHIRRGAQEGEDHLGKFMEADKEVYEELRKDGIGLYDDRNTFVAKRIVALDDAGINPVDVLDELYRQFDEFAKFRAGKQTNLSQSHRITEEEKATMVGKFVQFLKDIQSVMLLGQLMTSGTEIISTGLHMVLLPALRKAGGEGGSKWLKEYAGYAHAFSFAKGIFGSALRKGKGVLDDFDLKEGTYTKALDYEHMNPLAAFSWRVLFKFAVDLSIASSEFFKATRAFGIAYADGLEAALKEGMTPAKARKAAKSYATGRFDLTTGELLDEDLKIRAAETAFQQTFDGSTLTGKAGQLIENIRNSDTAGGLVSLAARSALPFFRTLANIGGNGAQYLMPPGSSMVLKRLYPEGTGVAKFLDDLTGKNGEIARQTALGRQRLGLAMVAGGFALTQVPGVEITGPSRGQRWDAKKRAFEEYPASSLIVNNTAYDLTRFLPFSAPLMLVGVLRDYQLEDELRMEGGEYDPTQGNLEWIMRNGQGYALTAALLLQDAGAARGMFDLFDAINSSLADGNNDPLKRYAQSYSQQYTPGPLRMANRMTGDIQYEGYTWLERWKASAGFNTEWERLDFFGNPIRYPFLKGVDPSNRRDLHLDDAAYREFAMLNRMEGLALVLDRPDGVFDSSFWRQIGLDPKGPLEPDVPSLVDLETTDGKNAWQHYRELIYQGRASEDVTESTSRYGDKVSVGKVLIREGETFEQAMRRLIELDEYRAMTPDARAKVWSAVFGFYRKTAKDELSENIKLDPSLFEKSRYGTPIAEPATIEATQKAGKALASHVQTTSGNPLDELFAIQE